MTSGATKLMPRGKELEEKEDDKSDLAHTHYNVTHGVGVQVMRIINYAHIVVNKFRSLSITVRTRS